MIRQFNILFTVNFTHNYFRDGILRDIEIVPTSECATLMRNYDLLFRKKGEQYVVLYQKNGDPAAISKRIDKLVKFTFLLKLKKAALQNFTDLGNNNQLSPVGRQSFYFNNIEASNGNINGDMGADGKMSLSTDQTVEWSDSLHLIPKRVNLPFTAADYPNVSVKGVQDDSFVALPTGETTQSNVVLDLSNKKSGAYEVRLEHQNNASLNLDFSVYADNDLTQKVDFGILEIFQDATIDYDLTKHYFIEFSRKNLPRKYFVVNASDKVISTDNNGIPNLEISHTNLVFNFISQPDLINQDSFYRALFDSFENANQEVYVFQSAMPLPLYEKDFPDIELMLGNNKLISNLPGANISSPKPNDLFIYI